MLKGLINRTRGQVRLRVTCPYPERVLNLCSARNLAFWDLEWEGENQFTCRVSRQDFRVLRQNGEKLDCEFHVLGREGAPYALGRLRRRQALAAGLLLWGVWLVLSSVLIWDIRITGNETVPKEEILRSLEKNGVRRGTWGLSVNGEDIRNHMLLDIPELSWAAVNVSGCRADVQVRERRPAPALLDRESVVSGSLPEDTAQALRTLGFSMAAGYISLPLPIGQRALLFGAGHISQALCPLLTTIGFRPVVFDDRPELANTRLFPTAEQVICGDFTRISDYLTITDEDFVVIMTSGHVRDFQVEEQTLRGDFAYVGVIGSRRKTASVNQRLLEAGIPQSSIDLVHTPIGTPILAVTPEEIAVSIAGEMIQVRAQRRGPTSHGCPMHG